MKALIHHIKAKISVAFIIYDIEHHKFNKTKRQALREAMTVFIPK